MPVLARESNVVPIINIEAVRGLGDKSLDPIVEPLLCTEAAALARATQEIDEHSEVYMTVDMEMVYRDNVQMADVLQVAETLESPYRYSKVTDISYNVDDTKILITVTARRPE